VKQSKEWGMSREAGNFVGAGAVMSAGIATGVVGGAAGLGGAMGVGMRAARDRVNAGDQGWDVDGKYVCAKMMFDFDKRQVFDGVEVHDCHDIASYKWEGQYMSLFFKGKVDPRKINMGYPQRCEMAGKLLEDMWNDVEFKPEKRNLFPTFMKRVHRLKPTTVIRYAIRSFFLGLVPGIPLMAGLGFKNDPLLFATLWFMGGVFAASVAWRKFKPVTEPVWRDAKV
jgi:hypothetical protein